MLPMITLWIRFSPIGPPPVHTLPKPKALAHLISSLLGERCCFNPNCVCYRDSSSIFLARSKLCKQGLPYLNEINVSHTDNGAKMARMKELRGVGNFFLWLRFAFDRWFEEKWDFLLEVLQKNHRKPLNVADSGFRGWQWKSRWFLSKTSSMAFGKLQFWENITKMQIFHWKAISKPSHTIEGHESIQDEGFPSMTKVLNAERRFFIEIQIKSRRTKIFLRKPNPKSQNQLLLVHTCANSTDDDSIALSSCKQSISVL